MNMTYNHQPTSYDQVVELIKNIIGAVLLFGVGCAIFTVVVTFPWWTLGVLVFLLIFVFGPYEVDARRQVRRNREHARKVQAERAAFYERERQRKAHEAELWEQHRNAWEKEIS